MVSTSTYIYIIGLILSIVLFMIFSLTIYRFSTTTVNAMIEKVNCNVNECQLNIVYYYYTVKVNALLTSKIKDWRVGQIIPIYINPKNLNSPKYAPSIISIILYSMLIILFLFTSFCFFKLYKIFKINSTYKSINPSLIQLNQQPQPQPPPNTMILQ